MKPLLSICIPTFNRACYLKECLDCITSQFIPENFKQTEIVVSDNFSVDDTEKVVKKFQVRFGNIKYYRNDRNLGFDRNVDNALTRATGKFRWTLSDDDYLQKDSLNFILNVIRKNLSVGGICVSDKEIETKEFVNGNGLLSYKKLVGGLLSQDIFNSKYLPLDRSKYYGNLWFHYSVFLEMIADRQVILVKNVFKTNNHSCRWANGGNAFFTFINLKNVIKNLLRFGYCKELVDFYLGVFARDLLGVVVSAKIRGLPLRWNYFVLVVREFGYSPLRVFEVFLLLCIPSFLYRCVNNVRLYVEGDKK